MKTGKAIIYCNSQEPFLRVFLMDGAVLMANNAVEQPSLYSGRKELVSDRYGRWNREHRDCLQYY